MICSTPTLSSLTSRYSSGHRLRSRYEETLIVTPRKTRTNRWSMRFRAGESCDFSVVHALRSADHDVLAIAEVSPREEDEDVMERAVSSLRCSEAYCFGRGSAALGPSWCFAPATLPRYSQIPSGSGKPARSSAVSRPFGSMPKRSSTAIICRVCCAECQVERSNS